MPAPVRILLGIVLGFFVASWVPIPPAPAMLSFAAVLAVLQEVLVGAALGFVLQLAFRNPADRGRRRFRAPWALPSPPRFDPSSGAQSGALGTFFGLVLSLFVLCHRRASAVV